MTNSLPRSWFKSKIIYEQIKQNFPNALKIRIASGFFTIKGWSQIQDVTQGKHIDFLVGINEPYRNDVKDAKVALLQEVMQDLRTGIAGDRYQIVKNLVESIQARQFRIVDARAMKHHAKLYIVDCELAIVTSANLTGNGLMRQVEAGNLLTRKNEVAELVKEFDEYFFEARDLTQELLEALLCWLKLSSPWDAYLKTLLALEDLELDSDYVSPTSYQRHMIAQTCRQIEEYNGAMLVASTGLGKTVIATHIALQLHKANEIKNVIIIGPKLVKGQWEHEFLIVGIAHKYIGYQALDKEDQKTDIGLEDFFELEGKINKKSLIIIDESHLFRNGHDGPDGPERRSFQRLIPLVETSGCKVLLLTGSPYSVNVENLNAQLCILPHTASKGTSLSQNRKNFDAWQVKNIEEFTNLDVVSQLTTPYVAKHYGQNSETGIFIEFGQEKRYIPHVMLHRIDFTLFMQNKILEVIQTDCFLVKEPQISVNNVIKLVEIAWVSSPLALCEVFQKVINTPGKPYSYKFEFEMSQIERKRIIEPVLKQFKQVNYTDNQKLLLLCNLLQNIHSKGNKAIVFCERRATVVYLIEALSNQLPNLRVFGTIKRVQEQYKHKSERDIRQAIKQFAPIANKVTKTNQETYDVFISTDAHGVGINLQDAPVVINYDLSWTPIEPTQRAGRVLRPWFESRTVELYTFVPPLQDDALQNLKISKRWKNLTNRHKESQKILDLPVLCVQEIEQGIDISSVTTKLKIQSGELNLDALVDENISPYYQHASRLHNNRNYARTIADDIISAKVYSGKNNLIYILFKYKNKYEWAVYEIETEKLINMSLNQLLNLLECDEKTERAIVSTEMIEKYSDICLKAWCTQFYFEIDEVVRVCTVYLKPKSKSDKITDLANN